MTDLFTEPYQPQLARKRLRVFAAVIDYLLVWGFTIFIGVSYGERYDTEEGGVGFRLSGEQSLICFGFWFVVLPLLEGLKGQTIGKMLFKIQVVSFDDNSLSMGKAIVRHLFDIVDWLPFFGIVGLLVASNNNNKQRVGDLVARTMVVQRMSDV